MQYLYYNSSTWDQITRERVEAANAHSLGAMEKVETTTNRIKHISGSFDFDLSEMTIFWRGDCSDSVFEILFYYFVSEHNFFGRITKIIFFGISLLSSIERLLNRYCSWSWSSCISRSDYALSDVNLLTIKCYILRVHPFEIRSKMKKFNKITRLDRSNSG